MNTGNTEIRFKSSLDQISLLFPNMPVSKTLPYQWYDTPNVHLCTINDFDNFCNNYKISVIERKVITDGNDVSLMPNLLGNLAMYRLRSTE